MDLQKRGLDYEARICADEFASYTRTPVNAEAFDAFDFSRGHGVSIKSLDTQTPAKLANPKSITGAIDKYINDIVNFRKIDRPSVPFLVRPEHVLSTELFVGIPKGTTLEQFIAIQRSAQRAELNKSK